MPLELRTHHSRDDIESLAREWDALVVAAPRPSPYLLWPWVDQWLAGPGATAKVAVVSAHRGGRLAGLLPTCIVRRHRVRALAFIGDRESWLADLLLAPGEPSSTALALLSGLRDMPYDVAAFTGVPRGSLLDAATAGRLRLVERAEHPVLDMPEGWEAAYAAKASSQRRSRDRKRERQLAAAGAYEEIIAESPAAIDDVFDDVLTLHELRWGGRRDGSEFGTPAGARAQRAALRRLADERRAGIVLLRLDGRPIGFQIWMTVGDTMYLHRSGVDPSAMRFSPGLIAMRRAIAHGAPSSAPVTSRCRARETATSSTWPRGSSRSTMPTASRALRSEACWASRWHRSCARAGACARSSCCDASTSRGRRACFRKNWFQTWRPWSGCLEAPEHARIGQSRTAVRGL